MEYMEREGFRLLRLDQIADGDILMDDTQLAYTLRNAGFDTNKTFTTEPRDMSIIVRQKINVEDTPPK